MNATERFVNAMQGLPVDRLPIVSLEQYRCYVELLREYAAKAGARA